MITFSKAKDFAIHQGKRILQVLQFGAKTAKVASAYGDDSNPINNMTAIYAETSVNSEPVILGYINTQQIAQKGEKRIFSQKENGDLAFEIYLKSDGSCSIKSADDSTSIQLSQSGEIEIKNNTGNFKITPSGIAQINGATNSPVRFLPMQTAFVAKDVLINAEFAKIATVLNSLAPGSYTPEQITTILAPAQSMLVNID